MSRDNVQYLQVLIGSQIMTYHVSCYELRKDDVIWYVIQGIPCRCAACEQEQEERIEQRGLWD